MKRLFAAAAGLALWSSTAFAVQVPDYDAFSESNLRRPVGTELTGRTKQLVDLGQVLHSEERLGVPTVFFAGQDPHAPSLKAMGLTALEAARRHLFDYAQLYRISPNRLTELTLKELHDTGRGAIIATFTESVRGIPVFRDSLHVIMDRDYKLVAITGYVSPNQGARGAPWNLARQTAIATAFSDLTGQVAAADLFYDTGVEIAGYHHFKERPSTTEGGWHANQRVRVKDVYFGLADRLVPAYFVELDVSRAGTPDSRMYSYVISAVDGRMLFRRNLTDADSYSYRVWAETSGWYMPYDGPQGTVGTPHPTGLMDGYQAPFIAPNLVTVEAAPFSNAATDPWLPVGATESIGNNVEAYTDLDPGDGFTPSSADMHATTNGLKAFDYTYDVLLNPNANSNQRQAAVTSLFFMNNFMHDWYYDHGFDELAGNAQTSNYNRGGEENDSIRAEGQDYGGGNNANMSTPPDGSRPRMQQYLFSNGPESYVEVFAPSNIAGTFSVGTAGFGAYGFDLTADVVYPLDSDNAHTACGTFAPGSLTGKIAMIDRGTCSFGPKALAAEQAGAVGVIIVNSQPSGVIDMGNTDPPAPVTIPTVMLSLADGASLKTEINAGQTVSARMFGKARDGTIDNAIVAHEWGHYLSERLVADASGLGNNQGHSMGEGWADFNSLLMMVRASDLNLASNPNFHGVYATATYVSSGGSNDGYFFGTRRVPYTTDMTKNGLTFGLIEEGVPLPSTFTAAYGQNGVGNSEVHSSGEVWCTMLWEGFVNLLNQTSKYTFDQAQNRMKDYLVASLKATPAMPTMLEARDALLAVVYASDKADFPLFTAGFAKRGAGMGAVAPDRYDPYHQNVTESFLNGGEAKVASFFVNDNASYCDHDGNLDSGETGMLSITVKNVGWVPLNGLTATLSTTTPGVTFGNNAQITFQSVDSYGVVSGVIPVSLSGATDVTGVDVTVELDDPSFAVPGPATTQIGFRANWDETAAISATDDVEAPTTPWTVTADANLWDGEQFDRMEVSPLDHKWHAPNPGAPADIALVSPPLNVDTTGNFSFTLSHRWSFEYDGSDNYDGAVIEISTDGGQTWNDLGATVAGYNGTIIDQYPGGQGTSDNPLHGRQGFVAESPGYATGAYVNQTFDLGTAYAGQTVQIRFRVGSDAASGFQGWDLDDIAFSGITNTPFHTVITDQGICVNRPPIAVAGPDQTVDERTPVTLDGSGSSDPDGDKLTLTWSQITGPAVTFTGNGTFVAPEVKTDTELTFALIASDGTLISPAVTARVLVRQVNRNPSAIVTPELYVDEREMLTLDGSHSFDIDGDALATYTWTQVSGPSVTLSDANAMSPTFTAPEVLEDSMATFELVVSDGDLTSDPATVNVHIKQVNRAPSVTIADQGTTAERTELTLTATGTDPDEEDMPTLSYHWTQVAGPEATIENPDQASLTFNAPEVTADSEVTFKVEVTDGDETRADRLNAEATVTFTVQQVNRAPFADAGQPRRIPSQAFVILGGDIEDPDGDAITISWKQTGGPDVQLNDATVADPRFRLPALTADTDFKFEVTVTDGDLTSTDDVVITGTPVASGCGCNAGDNGFTGIGALFALGAFALFARRRRVL